MNTLLAQMILVAQGEDLGKWTNILFVIVLIVFWVVGSIIKATAKKPEGEEEKEGQLRRKAGGKLREVAERIERELSQLTRDRADTPPERAAPPRESSRQPGQAQARPAGPPPRMRPGPEARQRPRPVGGALAAARKPGARPRTMPTPAFGLPEVSKVSPEMPQLPTGIEKLPEYITEPVEGLKDKYAHISAQKPPTEPALQALLDLDYADPEELKRAILHYEILGKPLSLREPGGQVIGL